MSKRTDGVPQVSLADPAYGEQAAFQAAQQGAPMGSPAPSPGMSGGGQAAPLIGLNEPTQRPDEPVTAGAALGPGIGPDEIGLGQSALSAQDLERLSAYLPALIEMANRPDSTPSFRNYVRTLRAQAR